MTLPIKGVKTMQKQISSADSLLRPEIKSTLAQMNAMHLLQLSVVLLVTGVEIADFTKKDEVLVKVYEYTSSGWPNHCSDPAIKPYSNRSEYLSLEDSCLLWGRREVIPLKLQGHLLDELHECHPGMCRMKAIARSFVW